MVETEVRNWVREYLAKLLGIQPADITLNQDLASYGLDSVDAVLMAGELEEAMGVEIDPAVFLQFPTLDAMIRALDQQRETGRSSY